MNKVAYLTYYKRNANYWDMFQMKNHI